MKSSRRVLYPFVGDTLGGSHISTLELVAGLDRDRYVPVVVLHQEGPLGDYLQKRGKEFIYAPELELHNLGGNLFRELIYLGVTAPRLVKFLKDERIDIVHTNDSRMQTAWCLPTKLAGARFIWHQRSASVTRRYLIYGHLADQVLAISTFCRDRLLPAMSRRALVVANPVRQCAGADDRMACRKALLEEAGWSHADAIIGFAARLMQQKRPLVFVEMAARLRDRFGTELLFPMIGDVERGLGEAVRDRISALKLERQCILLNTKYPIEPWLAACDTLVAPAVNEGFGRTLVEAMLCDVPVVAADHGGHKEIIATGETGILVPADDVEAFTAAVTCLLRNPSRGRVIAANAKKIAMVRYNYQDHIDAIEEVYASLNTDKATD